MDRARRTWLAFAAHCAAVALTGCGTVLHPERRGQPAGRIDWGIFALDAIGLIFFFIPGVIAFAVDFTTGAIYLPPECPPPGVPLAAKNLRRVKASTKEPTVAEVEAIVSRHARQSIELDPAICVTRPLEQIDDFADVHAAMIKDRRPT